MNALRKTRAAAGIELVDVPTPEAAGPDEVLVRVRATGICGSDLHVADWTPSYAFMRVRLRNCVPVPDSLSDELAALAEPLSFTRGRWRWT